MDGLGHVFFRLRRWLFGFQSFLWNWNFGLCSSSNLFHKGLYLSTFEIGYWDCFLHFGGIVTWVRLKKHFRKNIQLILFIFFRIIVLPGINGPILKVGIPIYVTLLMTMAWRVVARASNGLTEFLSAIGAIIFVISDGFIAVNLFYTPLSNAQFLIMSTYYTAQFLIALSGAKQEAMEKMKSE